MGKLRVGLTISGAVSLGSYEGGALAALLVALQELPDEVVIDKISGASAGAITGLVTARCLLTGADPVDSMVRAWVKLPSLDALATHSLGSPLSGRVLADAAIDLLGPNGPPPGAKHQSDPVTVSMSMVSLNGLGYRIAGLEGDTAVEAVTHLDWWTARFGTDSRLDDYVQASVGALASAANAAGFPPKLVPLTGERRDAMTQSGILDPPSAAGEWYTDGGTIDNEPFGRLLDLIGEDDDSAARLLLLVHPTPTRCPGTSVWSDPSSQPQWSRVALRAKHLQGDQEIYDDLRRLVKTNTRLQWVDKIIAHITDAVDRLDASVPEAASAARAALHGALSDAIVELDGDHDALNARLGRGPSARPGPGEGLGDLLRSAIHRATGLSGKAPARVEIVSPALDPSGAPAEELLCGEKLGHFFGFLDERFRRSDFALGWRHMRIWLEKDLPHRLGGRDLSPVLAVVDRRYQELAWDGERHGGAGFADLGFGEKLHLSGLGAHVAHVVEHDVRHWGARQTPE